MKKKEVPVVPFCDAKLRKGSVKTQYYFLSNLKGNRRVEVHGCDGKNKERIGVVVKTYRPTLDKKMAEFRFGLTWPAALALAFGILQSAKHEGKIR